MIAVIVFTCAWTGLFAYLAIRWIVEAWSA